MGRNPTHIYYIRFPLLSGRPIFVHIPALLVLLLLKKFFLLAVGGAVRTGRVSVLPYPLMLGLVPP